MTIQRQWAIGLSLAVTGDGRIGKVACNTTGNMAMLHSESRPWGYDYAAIRPFLHHTRSSRSNCTCLG
jgi:hypothetical protein